MVLGMLADIGIILGVIGGIILLGAEIKAIEQAVERIDPVHCIYLGAIRDVKDKSIDEELLKDQRAYPYDGPVSVNNWRWWVLSWFLERRVTEEVPRDAEVDISGGWFNVDGKKLTHSGSRVIQLEGGKQFLRDDDRVTLSTVYDLVYQARKRRIYIYGMVFVILGGLLELNHYVIDPIIRALWYNLN